MSFLGGLFKKKAGGTTVGNFLRGATSVATGGALGSGDGLMKWEIENGYRDLNGQPTLKYYSEAYNVDAKASNPLLDQAIQGGAAAVAGTPSVQARAALFTIDWFKEFGAWILLAIIGLWALLRNKVNLTVNQGSNKSGRRSARKK